MLMREEGSADETFFFGTAQKIRKYKAVMPAG
jgi:hypothetical protein